MTDVPESSNGILTSPQCGVQEWLRRQYWACPVNEESGNPECAKTNFLYRYNCDVDNDQLAGNNVATNLNLQRRRKYSKRSYAKNNF